MCAKIIVESSYIGKKYGKLTVVSFEYRKGHNIFYKCVCDCGKVKEKPVSLSNLQRGNTTSCGCVQSEARIKTHTTHGHRKERLYRILDGMKQRCYNPNSSSYHDYGARGIGICPEWMDYSNFRDWAYANGYDDCADRGECTIDRIDNNGDYCPENCQWVPVSIQGKNKRNNVNVEYNGETHNLTDLARIIGIKPHTLIKRYKMGYRGDRLFSKGNMQTGKILREG